MEALVEGAGPVLTALLPCLSMSRSGTIFLSSQYNLSGHASNESFRVKMSMKTEDEPVTIFSQSQISLTGGRAGRLSPVLCTSNASHMPLMRLSLGLIYPDCATVRWGRTGPCLTRPKLSLLDQLRTMSASLLVHWKSLSHPTTLTTEIARCRRSQHLLALTRLAPPRRLQPESSAVCVPQLQVVGLHHS